MNDPAETHLTKEDFLHALDEMDTYMDISVDDLMELNQRAAAHARIRSGESIQVSQLMTQPVLTVHLDSPLSEAAHLMVDHRISGLPVVDDTDRLIGIITEADLLRAMGIDNHYPAHSLWQTLENLFSHHREIKSPDTSVSDLMVTNVITVKPHQDVHAVLELLKKHHIKRVVVVNDSGRVTGMLTRSNLVGHFFDRIKGS